MGIQNDLSYKSSTLTGGTRTHMQIIKSDSDCGLWEGHTRNAERTWGESGALSGFLGEVGLALHLKDTWGCLI